MVKFCSRSSDGQSWLKNIFYYLENISIDSANMTSPDTSSPPLLILHHVVNSNYICHPPFVLDVFYKMSDVTRTVDLSVSI